MNIFVQVLMCLIVIVILVNFTLKRKGKDRRFYQLLKQFPSHPTYPLIGNAHLLLGTPEGFLERLEKILQPYDRQIYWMGSMPFLFLKKYDDIATVLNQSQDRDMLDLGLQWAGVGILNARCEEWKKSRKMMTPAFNMDMLSKYLLVFNKFAMKLVEDLKPSADNGEQIDIIHWIMMTNIESIVENTVGVTIANSGELGVDFKIGIIESLKDIIQRFTWPILFSSQVYEMYFKISGKKEVRDRFRRLPTEILKKKLNDYHNIESKNNGTEPDNANSSKTFIDLLIKNGLKEGGLTETRIRDEILHVCSAGTDSTVLTLSFLMLMLALNQEIQQKVYEEIIQIPEDDMISETHLSNGLKYLEQCIRETLRMYTLVYLNSRRTHKEILLKGRWYILHYWDEVDNTIVPKDMFVIVSTYSANHDANLYKNPERWDPEHFSDQAVKERPKTSQLSFGYGPRSCIGSKYAMMSMKTQVVYMLRNYHLSTNIKEFTKHHLKGDINTRSKIGYPIKLTSRRKQEMKR